MPLATPVDHGHGKAAVAQVAHGLEIFFDLLAAPGEHAHRALAPRRRRPARETQLGAVRRLDRAADDVLRHRIGGNGDERHGAGRLGKEGLESRAGAANFRSRSRLLNSEGTLPYHLHAGRSKAARQDLAWPRCGRAPSTVAQWRTLHA